MITEFRGRYGYLSNFYPATSYGYPTAEHAFQASKTINQAERIRIREANTPTDAKRLGRRVTLRVDWEEIKDQVMYKVVRRKFIENPDLGEQLIATGTEKLVEGNHWHDNYWGDCSCSQCQNRTGHNQLGKVLMNVRKELNTNIE